MKRLLFFWVLAAMSFSACQSKRATPEECRIIFNRLVSLELAEMGFDDPALAKRRQVDFAYRYRDDIAACIGRKIPADAMACVLTAKTAEDVSHECLR